MRELPDRSTDPNLLVGTETSDDAGVYLLPDGSALVQTLDFFPPLVDDPFTFGQIAATNALSDIYAMNGRPLTAMSILPEYQRQGIGRQCLEQAIAFAKGWPADTIRLDAWDHVSGAGEFYAKCGYREVGRVAYRGAALVYFELPL